MKTRSAKYKSVPKYHGLRIYLISTVLYFFLVFPVAGILVFNYFPDIRNKALPDNPLKPGQQETTQVRETGQEIIVPPQDTDSSKIILYSNTDSSFNITLNLPDKQEESVDAEGNAEGREQMGDTMFLLIRLLFVSFILGMVFNFPFRIYFRRLRTGKPIKPRIAEFCRKFLLRSPMINVGILFLSYGITILYMVFMILMKEDLEELNRQLYLQFFYITLVSSLLTLMLVYFWMKHRVHLRYLEHVFSQEDLKKRIFNRKPEKIRNRLLVSSAMTTFLPLIIVVFYILLSVTSVKDLDISQLSSDQEKILLGKYIALDLGLNGESIGEFFYVNAINSLLMVLGIGTSIFIALIYIVLFVRWTTEDIVMPVAELLDSMEQTGRGELDSFCVVRTNDEIGALTEGYNQMSERLKNYFLSLDNVNRANARFVPRQFLEFLGKENITEIQLGDQVQKEMTIMFSDIRDFTALSETMTPKENFDFINNYLGYMEPVIRNNNGFIDKFMGDAIMALFADKSEDALNAAIEMRIKMLEYNEIISQFGKPAIDAGIGIHTGLLMLGIIGGEGRMDGTVISDAVNLAARLEGLTKVYGSSIIITEDTLIKLTDPNHYHFRFLDIVKVKGKKEAIYIFEIMDGEPDTIRNLKLSTKEDYNKAMQAYKKKEFRQALATLQKIEAVNPMDKAVKIYLNRCATYIEKGVPEMWDGVESFDLKY